MLPFLIALMALVGTFMQAVAAAKALKREEAAMVASHEAVAALKKYEARWWHLLARRRQRKEVKDLLNESPLEYKAWRAVENVFLSWALLMTAAFFNAVLVIS